MASRTVLVVEDDVTINETLCAILEAEGYRATCVTNLSDARRVLGVETPSIILLDLMLNDDETGETLLAELADHDSTPSVVLFSASPEAKAIAARFDIDLIAKPFDVDDLLETLARGIDRRRAPTLRP